MKTAPVILALLGFGTALVQTLDAMDARRHEAEAAAYGTAKDAQAELLLAIVTENRPCD